MLERYFKQPSTLDRLRASWIAVPLEQYVIWLAERGHSDKTVWHRVPVLMRFGDFARTRGATCLADLPDHVDAFIQACARDRRKPGMTDKRLAEWCRELSGPVNQMLHVAIPGYAPRQRSERLPFEESAPGFFTYLAEERGLRPHTLDFYKAHMRRFETYLHRVEVTALADLSPVVLGGFIADCSTTLCKDSLKGVTCDLRIFLRYLHREGIVRKNLASVVESPMAYRLAKVPRSITWAEVSGLLDGVDRRTGVGKRDYAILLLLVTYGLRSREVAHLTLDDIDWRAERLRVPERKAGHSTAYPLSAIVGDAMLAYLREGRPASSDRHVFLSAGVPFRPMTHNSVSTRATHYLKKAGITVPRPGSHTLRHTCVQRLVDTDFSLKTIGDYVGHRSAASTEVYTKVAIEALREVALGDGEAIL